MKVLDATTQPQQPILPTVAKSLTSTVFQLLRNAIIGGQLEPGAKLSAGHLANQYRISLSAIREALARLAAEGLLESEDHRGFRVARVSKEDLLDLTQTRIDIECMALRRSIERGGKEWEARLTTAFKALQSAEGKSRPIDQRRYELHSDFHLALVEACGSDWLLRLRRTLFERAERYRLLSVTYAKVRQEVNAEHKQLYDAVIKRNADKACAILTKHTLATTEALLKLEEGRPNSIFRAVAVKPKRAARNVALLSPTGLVRTG